MSALVPIVDFVNADRQRFMSLSYYGGDSSYAWELGLYLGTDMTCDGVRVIGEDRWLSVKAAGHADLLAKAVEKLATVRPLKKAAAR